MAFRPRLAQQKVLGYSGGRMGVAAVPGSGKTQVLSALAARLVARDLGDNQEVLIVTLVNSAVDNFASRIYHVLQDEYDLLPGIGYRVRTLHGLANDIVRERPSLVGLADDFAIADEREAGGILNDAVQSWQRSHPELLEQYMDEELDEGRRKYAENNWWPDLLQKTAGAFVRRAKDGLASPEVLRSWLGSRQDMGILAQFCVDVYADYQRSLAYRGKVDFDGLVSYALEALRLDEGYLQHVRHRWPFILEDEAQDSSRLQQELLALMAGPNGRWVRVGDPNQAVFYTFTTANPKLLAAFLGQPGVVTVEMDQSGRCARPILGLANHLVDWTLDLHPLLEVRDAFRRQHVYPTPADDPQPNPPDAECHIYFHGAQLSPDAEVELVVRSLARWVPDNPERTSAILVPDNKRGFKFAEALRQKGLPCLELLNSAGPTRDTADILERVLKHLADPDSAARLGDAFLAWRWFERSDKERYAYLTAVSGRLKKCTQLEDYLWPKAGADWLTLPASASEEEAEPELGQDEEALELLRQFRVVAQRWHQASGLPIDQLILTLGQDLFKDPGDLARAYHFAVVLRDYVEANPHWRLPELALELHTVASNERRFLGLSAEDTGFDPDAHRGEVVVATMHRAKGLEWDRVHLTAINNYDFPSGGDLDIYRSEKWFVRDNLDLVAEALGQLEALQSTSEPYLEGAASTEARLEYIRERLRLLYVGITRARRELVITWNTGLKAKEPKQPALAFTALRTYWEQKIEPH